MPSPAVRFAVAALATWRVTHLLAEEDGPADAIVRARVALGESRAGALMDCFQCLSLWTAAPFAAAAAPARARVTWWLALSGAACLLERGGATPDEEVEDGLLREAQDGAQGGDAPAGGRGAAAGADGAPDAGERAGGRHAAAAAHAAATVAAPAWPRAVRAAG